MVGRVGSTTGTVYADMTLTRSKVKVKVTGLLNFRKLAKSCMHASSDDHQPLSGAFWLTVYYQNTRMWANPNVMVALPNIGGALCSTPQSLADAQYLTAVQ